MNVLRTKFTSVSMQAVAHCKSGVLNMDGKISPLTSTFNSTNVNLQKVMCTLNPRNWNIVRDVSSDNSSAGWARELFKPSEDEESLLVSIEKIW